MQPITPARKKVSTDYKIPLIIHQKHNSYRVPAGLAGAVQQIIDLNPQFEHRYYDDEAMYAYIEEHADENYNLAFKRLRTLCPYSYKAFEADLFRYLLLTKEGGVWIDADVCCYSSLLPFMKPSDQFLTPHKSNFQNFILSVPNFPIMSVCLDEAVKSALKLRQPKLPGITLHAAHLNDAVGAACLWRAIIKLIDLSKTPELTDMAKRLAHGEIYSEFEFNGETCTWRVPNGFRCGGVYAEYFSDLKLLGAEHWRSSRPKGRLDSIYRYYVQLRPLSCVWVTKKTILRTLEIFGVRKQVMRIFHSIKKLV